LAALFHPQQTAPDVLGPPAHATIRQQALIRQYPQNSGAGFDKNRTLLQVRFHEASVQQFQNLVGYMAGTTVKYSCVFSIQPKQCFALS
jgi:hypothetical protein